MSPMIYTYDIYILGHCRQDNIIYKCTMLHDDSKNRKCAAHAIFWTFRGTFKKKNFFVLMSTFI